jgi:omega-3 fatty acid desaturase (delta-15 desaturase)
MAPCIAVETDESTIKDSNLLQLANLRKAIPLKAFKKSLFWSSFYLFFDYSVWLGSLYAIIQLNKSDLWAQMPFWQQCAATVVYWNICGFYMWCIFVVGHDCGHTNFSNYPLLNDIVGHITHGSILVPYYPWQVENLI